MRDRLHVDHRYGGVPRELGDHEILAILFPALEFWKRTHADEIAVARENPRDLLDVLLRVTIHHHPVAILDRPGTFPGLEDDGVTAQLEDANLERRTCAQ